MKMILMLVKAWMDLLKGDQEGKMGRRQSIKGVLLSILRIRFRRLLIIEREIDKVNVSNCNKKYFAMN